MERFAALIRWCNHERISLRHQLELLEFGQMTTGENRGAGMVDTTDRDLQETRRKLSELDELLSKLGRP